MLNDAGSIIMTLCVHYNNYIIDHKYNPDSHLTMKALVTLERGMNVPVLTKLRSNSWDITKLTGVHAKQDGRQTRDSSWPWPYDVEIVGHSLNDCALAT